MLREQEATKQIGEKKEEQLSEMQKQVDELRKNLEKQQVTHETEVATMTSKHQAELRNVQMTAAEATESLRAELKVLAHLTARQLSPLTSALPPPIRTLLNHRLTKSTNFGTKQRRPKSA